MASTNLVQNSGFESGTTGWPTQSGTFAITAANGPSATGTASALLGGGSLNSLADITQQIATIPGTNYVVQFDYKTLDSNTARQKYTQVSISDSNGFTLLNLTRALGADAPTTVFQTAVGAFTAISGGATLQLAGYDSAVVDNVVIATGSYSEPGKYTGSLKVSSTIPSVSIGSFHTESVVARITPSGGVYLIEEPSGIIEAGGFENENTLAISGTTATVSVKAKTDIKFTVTTVTFTGRATNIPVTNTETFSLKKAGK